MPGMGRGAWMALMPVNVCGCAGDGDVDGAEIDAGDAGVCTAARLLAPFASLVRQRALSHWPALPP